MIYYLIYDSEDTYYTIYYKRSPNSEFLFNQAVDDRWGSIEHAFSKLDPNPSKLKRTSIGPTFSVTLEFTQQSHPEFFI